MFHDPIGLTGSQRLFATMLACAGAALASWLHARGWALQFDPRASRTASNLRDGTNLAAVALLGLAFTIAGLDRPLAFLSSASVLIVAELARVVRVPQVAVAGIEIGMSALVVLRAGDWTRVASFVAHRALADQG